MSEGIIDENGEVDISIWVSTKKNPVEFLDSLAKIVYPVVIENGIFKIGAIEVQVKAVEKQPRGFEGIPQETFSFELVVPTTPYLIWGCFDRRVVYAITLGLRTKFQCSYLVTTDLDDFIFYSGTNKPYYINLNYQSCVNGELLPIFKDKRNVIEVRL